MDNKDEQGEHAPRGNEWEVVSLTASAYAAAPGPYNIELRDARKYDTYYEAETSNTLFMSDHFVFPPSEHENVPVETFFSEPDNDKGSKYVDPLFETDQAKHTDEKDEKDSTMRGADLPNAFSRTWFRDEMGNKKQSIYGESTLGSVQSETASSRATKHEHESHYVESNETLEGGLDLHSDASNLFRSPSKDAKDATYNLPCEAWWRRRVVSVYAHAKEAKAFWSLFFAAAVTGLVILGQRWQQERWQGLHLKWQSSIGSEKLSRVLGPLAHFKDSAAGVN
ncbi:PREDICTED: ATG8-interacting protein 1-like [Tarenaya hassleriana]|uniref:ATG8-interacting protein 1-like n=1 Tax=Tarenaya hassleriana TaxID=28532 RepID=UPI00053C487A|nr:PREDICTED: ATG8-interacting protein 1-like [Tarenaya hassleriana]